MSNISLNIHSDNSFDTDAAHEMAQHFSYNEQRTYYVIRVEEGHANVYNPEDWEAIYGTKPFPVADVLATYENGERFEGYR